MMEAMIKTPGVGLAANQVGILKQIVTINFEDKENNKRWIIRGKFVRANTSTVKISELPPSMTYEKYEDILDKLVDDKIIVSYDDNCKDNNNNEEDLNVLNKMSDVYNVPVGKIAEITTRNSKEVFKI